MVKPGPGGTSGKLTVDHLLEEVLHDLSMPGCDCGPQSACDAVVQLHEGGEEQRVLLAFEEQFARQPEAAAGAKGRNVRVLRRISQPSTNRSG